MGKETIKTYPILRVRKFVAQPAETVQFTEYTSSDEEAISKKHREQNRKDAERIIYWGERKGIKPRKYRRLAAYDSPPTDGCGPWNAVSVDDPNYQRDLRRLKTSEGRRRLAPHDSPPSDGWGPWKAVPVDHPNYQRDLRRFLASKAADRNC